ncbi:glucose 1-dehydrogenase [Caulobacter sp. BK020]|uniref:SDR family NAD(P)-dependent oxidoreductase n=1 Tax=Caulobacter sp. BK020 TaxID=2512117 RepID=UPI001044EB35|nr:glucose 1-dehydrogenase [Caulobacter sp. BK020]TCS15315.1 3alpha(or 20beta)-hydroxysteroid dehydrogenase [Caulobacter sp. BK020]
MPNGRLEGKRALVTGAAGGLGAAIAARFVADGARVLLGDVDRARGEQLARDLGDRTVFVTLDVAAPPAWNKAMEIAATAWGGLDVLVNNAALASPIVPIEQRDPADWDRMMAINLGGPFLGARAALPVFRAGGGGVIVNVSSVAGLGQSGIMDPAYACSKAGLTMLTRIIAAQHARDGVRCNSVHPGPIDTPLARATYADTETLAQRLSRIPAGRFAQVEEVVAAIVYLASEESAYVTGVALGVDGGALVQ